MQSLQTLGLQTLGIKPRQEPKKLINKGVREQLRDFGSEVIDTVQRDLIQPAPDILAQQVVGVELPKASSHGGEMKPGHEVELSHGKSEAHADSGNHGGEHAGGHHATTEIGHHYTESIIGAGGHAEKHEAQERAHETHAILGEITQLAHGNEEMETIIVNTEQHAANGSIQNLNWAERVLEGLRKKVDTSSSASWMGAVKDKANYWSQAKTKGTSFTQSNERSVATQVG